MASWRDTIGGALHLDNCVVPTNSADELQIGEKEEM
jgi:hypothetical protein